MTSCAFDDQEQFLNDLQYPTAVQSHHEASAESELVPTIMRLLRLLMIRKKTIIIALYLFAVCGVIYYYFAVRLYESSAKILIDGQNQDRVATVGDQSMVSNIMDTHSDLVTSPVVIEQAIEYLDPEHRTDIEGLPPSVWVRNIESRLGTRVTRKKSFIEVTYRSNNPETAAAVVRAVIKAYLAFVGEHHKGTAGEIIAALTTERDQIQSSLKHKQQELQQFRQRVGHLAVSTEDGVVDPKIQRVMKLNDTLLLAQEKRLSLQASLATAEAAYSRGEDLSQHLFQLEATLGKQVLLSSMGMSPQDLQVINTQQEKIVAAQQEVQNLSLYYGPNYPRIVELGQEILSLEQYIQNYHSGAGNRFDALGKSLPKDVVVKLLRQSTQHALEKEKQIQLTYEKARTEAAAYSGTLVQYRALEREVAREEARRDMLTDKIASIDFRQIQVPIRATVVRAPLANSNPVTPQLRLVAVVCLLGGAFSGIIVAYAQDVLADRFNSPEELSLQLGVPVLAMVKKLDSLPGESLDTIHTHACPNAPETEAFRTLRTVLSLSEQNCDRILISSSEPGDGKTTISANLSVALAQAGNRTLVIDADLRRPGFTTLMNLKGQAGVADLLTSAEAPASAAPPLIHHTAVDGLDFLPAGLRRPNPAELLSGKGFVELLAWAESKYDRVVVDCPPVLAVSDAQIIGQLVDGAILVVQPEKNHRRLVMRAVESFHAAGCHLFGVVANGLSSDSQGYGYGYGYGYSYTQDGDYEHGGNAELPNEALTTTAPPEQTDGATIAVNLPHQWSSETASANSGPVGPAVTGSSKPSIKPRRAA
ncbi:MAG: polysaccharide biosynthesis tyrosine autokinase [Pirellulales bacterium]|nr:polysaccharide biosynthesis tyrosine autokinase [Pirellulales bacterium]